MAYEIIDEVENVPTRGAAGKYPFHQLSTGKSFLVPYETPGKKEDGSKETKEEVQARQLSALRGAVQGAQAKYAEKTGEKRTNRNGAEVDAVRNTRTFSVAHHTDKQTGKVSGRGFAVSETTAA